MGNSKISNVQLILFGLIAVFVLLALLLLLGVIGGGGGQGTSNQGDLVVWGFNDEYPWRAVAGGFTAKNPGVRVKYRTILKENYYSELLNALAAGVGPDIFMLKESDLYEYKDKTASVVSSFPPSGNVPPIIGRDEFKQTYVDATHEGLVTPSGDILGLPLSLNSLALFYNKDFFNSANIPEAPQTWTDFQNNTRALSALSSEGAVARSGAALGEYANVDHFVDIISAFIFQAGGKIFDPVKNEVLIALAAKNSTAVPAETARPL
ncbi:MAG: extracellular solute-binding protein [Candidatus Sungbacteria bacterium]|nr:extracellular solute-binding protein [Candidatus Sungbacteria bacterium]